MLTVNLTTEQKVLLSIAPASALGNPATVDGVPVWTLIQGDAELLPSEDGMSCEVLSGAAGVINEVEVSADADRGEGVRAILDRAVVVVDLPEAETLGMSAVISNK
jgi:hypothetical protein